MKTIIIFFLLISSLSSFSQTKSTVDTLEKEYQKCLDKGQYMLSCTKVFYNQMDSLLNLRYKKLRSLCDSTQKENLKDEQIEWLSKRDKYFTLIFKQTRKEAKKGGYINGTDEQMIYLDKNAEFVKGRVIELISTTPENYSAENYKVEATGIYNLDNKTEIRNGETYGYYGDIKIKRISSSKIVLRLFVCKGAPSYNSGVAMDTLTIKDNKAIFTTQDDPSCKLIFTFYRRGIMIDEFADNINFACGFGHAVVVYGFYKRKQNAIPTDKELTKN